MYLCIVAKKQGSHLAYLLRVELGHELAATFDYVVALEGVEHLLTLFAAGHQAELLEDAQVVGDGRLGHSKGVHDVTDTHFPIQQHHQNPLPGIVGQGSAKRYAINGHGSLPNP